MDNPSISVVLPLYNHAHYIASTLQSVLEQTSPVDEIILIDDGSTDNGFSVACEMLKNEPRATLLQQKNCGAEQTLNRAIERSQGEFIAVLNTDDLFLPTKIERCREIIGDNPEIDFICGGIGIIDEKKKVVQVETSKVDPATASNGMMICTQCKERTMISQENCLKCLSCGYSKCS